jgi:hypothetical protein
MRYYLELKDGSRVTFVSTVVSANVEVLIPGTEESMSKAQARTMWSQLRREGAQQVECNDEDGHDGFACTCSSQLEKVLEVARTSPPPGSWAETARMLADAGFMTGDEADAWKDQMKEGD